MSQLFGQHFTPDDFLAECEIIDFRNSEVAKLAGELAGNDTAATAKLCFEFVRDEIKHSYDYQCGPVTLRAPEVLKHRTRYCYAKSHLLCALLRANQIPSELCYQRLTIDGISAPYCLHGLVALYLPKSGWYRVDPRGNRDGIDAKFCPPVEKLAFSTDLVGEYDIEGIYAVPLPAVVEKLSFHTQWRQLAADLPDIMKRRVVFE